MGQKHLFAILCQHSLHVGQKGDRAIVDLQYASHVQNKIGDGVQLGGEFPEHLFQGAEKKIALEFVDADGLGFAAENGLLLGVAHPFRMDGRPSRAAADNDSGSGAHPEHMQLEAL